jgi:VCBS repeat-containing protein
VLVVKAETGATVDVVVNGKTYRATESTTTKGEYEVKISDALDDATYTPSITVTDEAGNKTTRNGVAFTVDNSAGTNPANGTSTDKNPADQNSGANTAIAITAVSEDTGSSATDFITSDKSVLVSGTVANFYNTGASADDAVRVQIFDAYDKLVAQAYATPQSNGSSTWAMTAPTAALVDGDYTIKADIVDAAGNVVKSGLPQALKISANYLSAEPDVAIAQEAGYEEDNKTPIKAKNPTGNVLSNDIDVKSDGRLVTGAKVGEEGALKEVATGTSKDNGSSLDGRYGKLLIGADGTYEYILEESKANVLTESDEKTETFTYEVKSITGGTSSATLTVTVKGSNDLAVIGSTSESSFAGTVLAGATTVSGKVTVSDVDADQAAFQTPQKLIGDYGFFTFTQSSGTWIYEVDTSKAAYAALKKDEAATDTLDITSLDGSAIGTVTVTVNGVNDSPQLASVDGLAVSSDNRNISDPQGTKGATRLKDLVGGITDVDSTFAKGIAVTDVSNKGVLWYSVDGGAKWISATPTEATISNGNSLLLAADNSTYVYFQQTSSTTSTFDASSVVTSFIFKAWDTTTGSAGDYVNANSGGGTTAFSAKEQAVLVNDVFNIIGITSPLSVNGGSGFDTLVLNGSGLNLDLTVPSAVSLSRVERVDLKGTGNNTINLNLASVLQADAIDNIHTLYINGDNGDTVSFVSSAGLTTTSIEQTINSVRYNVYHLDSTHDLLIQQAITNVTFS